MQGNSAHKALCQKSQTWAQIRILKTRSFVGFLHKMCCCFKTRSTTVGQNMHKRLNADEKCRSEEEDNSEFTVPGPSAWKRRTTYLLLLLWWWKATSPIMVGSTVSAQYGVMQCPCISYFCLVLLLSQVLNGWFYIQRHIFVDEITSTLAFT